MAAATGVTVIVADFSGADRGLAVLEIGIVLRFCVVAQHRVKRWKMAQLEGKTVSAIWREQCLDGAGGLYVYVCCTAVQRGTILEADLGNNWKEDDEAAS
ncbi:hypothetical protein F0562_010631 [Nyssa sinensis]|uniref:Uncharacterized protein n=1 Tax=Nyssa sinensis TaxID=561372 RepID=A0A5J5A1P5_9ASTE|nr:hypothetical protein F0562_010631 [Nyssa sinensis]